MSATNFLLMLISAAGGSIQGRTNLQKTAFFVSILSGIDPGLGFDAHYYGPYSSTTDGTVFQLKNLGFVQESSTGFGVVSGGFEMKRYDYVLTDDGRKVVEPLKATSDYAAISKALERIKAAGDPNYVELSIAAKTFFILRGSDKPASPAEVIAAAKRFDWNITPQALEKAVHFLIELGLISEE